MNNRTCTIDGCERLRYNFRGWCNMHYQRWRKHGTTDGRVKTPRGCKVSCCDRNHYAKGYCASHWKQQFRGIEVVPLTRNALPFEERLWRRVNKTPTCWLWTGALNDTGYAPLWNGQRNTYAHRVIYELMVSAIPQGLELDHICFVPNCVNPQHLRVVNRKQNIEHKNGSQRNSKTGVLGVSPRPYGRFVAEVKHHGTRHRLGTFATLSEADVAVRAKRAELFTHDDAVY